MEDEGCTRCNCAKETILQVLQDCQEAHKWSNKIVSRCDMWSFYSASLHQWMWQILKLHKSFKIKVPWSNFFGVTLWRLWRRQNEELFGNVLPNQCLINEGISVCQNFMHAQEMQTFDTVRHINGTQSTAIWHLPPKGIIKINTNASIDKKNRCAFISYLARDNTWTMVNLDIRKSPIACCCLLKPEQSML